MSYTLPTGWVLFGTSNDGNTVTYQRPGHTVKEPRLAVVSRVLPVYNSKSGKWSTPHYRVRVFDGVLDALGVPSPTRTSFDSDSVYAVNPDGSARGTSVMTDALAILTDEGFIPAAFGDLSFPTTV